MATSLSKKNNKVIERAYKRAKEVLNAKIEREMLRLLPEAMDYAIRIHDNVHFGHRTTANSYGWLLMHDGRAIAHGVNDGRHGEGNAEAEMMKVSRGVPSKGWYGIILASMDIEFEKGKKNVVLVVDYEEDILHSTMDDIKEKLVKAFK